MTTVAENTHVVLDKKGVAWVEDTGMKVMDIVLDHIAYGWNADQIHEQHPPLSLAQIHSVLAFYYDHQNEFETQIQHDLKAVKQLKKVSGESAMQRRLRLLVNPA